MFKNREHVINVILGVILAIIVVANIVTVIRYRSGDRFEWSHGVYAKKGNIIQVNACSFSYDGSHSYPVNPGQILKNGRREVNYAERSVENAFYPNQLSTSWYSYTEEKFYEGNFELPYTQINRIAEQLRKTTDAYETSYARANPNKIHLYFNVEVSAGGELVVFMSDLKKYVEIGKYKAKSVTKTAAFFKDPHAAINTKDLPTVATRTSLVMEQYPYTIQTIFPQGLKLRRLLVEPYNQDNWKLPKEMLNEKPQLRHIPNNMTLAWGDDSKEYTLEYYFKAEEILAAFKSLHAISTSAEIILMVDVNEKNNKVTVSLKRENQSIKLNDAYDNVEIRERTPQKDDE